MCSSDLCELCNVILLQGIMYVNYAMPCGLGKRRICELYQAILFSLRITFVNNVSTFNYSSCASAI